MSKQGKGYRSAVSKVEDRQYEIPAAIAQVRECSWVKFDETLEIAMRLGVDPKHADQMVRGTVVLPHGTGRSVRILVFASGEKLQEAEAAGADFAGGDDLAEKILGGWLDFDAVVATPDMMRVVGRLGRVLGPRGMMPNPKTGTVTPDVAKAVGDIKAGKVEFRVDKAGIIHAPLGKLSFTDEQLVENTNALVAEVLRAKPASSKGRFVFSVNLSSSMGPGVPIDPAVLGASAEV